MNYLAHCYLSGANRDILVGNMMGDFVKGRLEGRYSGDIARGLALHRAIDAFTDAHAIFKASKARIGSKHRRYAGILIDIFYDHFLACNWERYSQTELTVFARQVYDALNERRDALPDRLLNILPYMIENDWLASYRRPENIAKALRGMSRRLSFENDLPSAMIYLHDQYDQFESDFTAFFRDVIAFVRRWEEPTSEE